MAAVPRERVCVSTDAFVRLLHTHVPRRRVRVFQPRERERDVERRSVAGRIERMKRDREIRRRQVNGGRKREVGRIIRALDGRKLEGRRRIARR